MAIYRKVDVCLWVDKKFRALSDDAKMLWLNLLTTPLTVAIPGVIIGGPGAISEVLDWEVKRFTKPFDELTRNGFVKGCLPARLVWLPKALKRNPPHNPNSAKAWSKAWPEVPECELKTELWHAVKPFAERFLEPFEEWFPEPFAERYTKQDQDQEQKKEHPPEAVSLATLLLELILKRDPESKLAQDPGSHIDQWADHIEKLNRLDKRSWEEIRRVLEWSQADLFWSTNIRSGKKLREKFETLRAQSGAKKSQQPKPEDNRDIQRRVDEMRKKGEWS